MPVYNVTLHILDDFGRETTRRVMADVADETALLVSITALEAEWTPMTDGAITSIDYTRTVEYANTPVADANVDRAAKMKVEKANGFKDSFKLPIIPLGKVNADGTVDLADADLVALFALFDTGGDWKVNQQDPQFVTSVISGRLDK